MSENRSHVRHEHSSSLRWLCPDAPYCNYGVDSPGAPLLYIERGVYLVVETSSSSLWPFNMTPKTQTALIQSRASSTNLSLPCAIEPSCPLADSPSPYHVLVRVCAVGLNPSDWKFPTRFFMEGNGVGSDFCGFVEEAGPLSDIGPGARVCGAVISMYQLNNSHKGAFAQYTWVDSRRLLRVPESWSAVQAAALGSVSWTTSAAAISDPEALGLAGLPSKPADKPIPVLVYGGATATGIMATQLLKLSVNYLLWLIYIISSFR